MITWTQVYTPAGNLLVSALIAAIPVAVLLGLLAFSKLPAWLSSVIGLVLSMLVAIFIYKMPATLATMAAVNGVAYGLFPIGWIVLCAMFVYDITVHTGQFEIVKHSIAGLADDRRVQALLIAFSFGAFIEGTAGFGTPVAISAAMLMGLGFKPLSAATLSLIGNTAPVAFGALGTPIVALARVTGIDIHLLSAMVGRQLPFFAIIVPFWLIWSMAGWRKMMEVWPACLTAGLSFGIVQFAISNYHGPWLVDVGASMASILSMLVLLKFWRPRTTWRFEHDDDSPPAGLAIAPFESQKELEQDAATMKTSPAIVIDYATPSRALTGAAIFRAWMPWIIVSVIVFIWGLPGTKAWMNSFAMTEIHVKYLDKAIFRAPPVVAEIPKEGEAAVFQLNYLSASGTALLICGILSGLLLGLGLGELVKIFLKTLHRVRTSLLTIAAMLAIGYSTRYGGLDATLGLAFASTGVLFPFFSPMLGWLGVALTGSDTASNVLFGNLQQITATQLHISPVLAAASNSSGGVMGKMIDAQSIVVATVATGEEGTEGQILRHVFFQSIALAALVGLLVMLQAYVLTGMVP